MRPSLHRVLVAYLHAAAFLSVYLLVKELIYWTPLLDSLVSVVGTASILLASLIVPHFVGRSGSVALSGLAAGVLTAVVTIVIWSLVWSDWASDKPIGYAPVTILVGLVSIATTVLWLISMGCMVAAIAVGGGLAAAAAAAMRRPGRDGVALVLVASLLASVVPAAASFARLTAGIGVIDLAMRYETLRPFPAKVVVDLAVRGERVVLERVVTCRRPRSIREEGEAARANPPFPKPYWFPSLKSFGHVFADGSGVFVVTPSACSTIAETRRGDGGFASYANVLASDYRPLIGWTAAANSLQTFDLYVDQTAYERANAPVQVNALHMAPLSYGARESAPDFFASIGWMRHYTSNPEHGAYYAVAIPPAAWEAHPLAGPQLKATHDVAFVFGGNAIRPVAMGAAGYEDLDAGTRFPVFGRNGSGIPPRLEAYEHPLPGPIVPLRREREGWRLFPQESGVISFERGLRTDTHNPPMPDVVAIGSRRADRRGGLHDGAYVFDPGKQTLYRIMPTSFHLAEPDSIYASQTCDWGCSDWLALIKKVYR